MNMPDDMTPQEFQRVVDCVSACERIDNPAAIMLLLVALAELIEAWNKRGLVAKTDPECAAVVGALDALGVDASRGEAQN